MKAFKHILVTPFARQPPPLFDNRLALCDKGS